VRNVAILVAGFVIVVVVAIALRQGDPVGPRPSGSDPAVGRSGLPSDTTRATAPASAGESPRQSSAGPAASGDPVAVLVGAGDIADCGEDGDEVTAELIESIPGTVFTLGDNAYENGTPRDFQNCYGPTWGRASIKDRTRPVAGNHDYQTRGAAGYFGYFGAAAGDPAEGWYAYDAGTWRIYVLNSNCDEIGGCEAGSAQERWLRGDLAANPRTCVAAMWHHPRFTSGAEHGSDPATSDLWLALQEAGAELVLAGHEHLYERFGPQDANGAQDEQRGLVEFVVGTGGRQLYAFGEIEPNSLIRENTTFGVLELMLAKGSYAFTFTPVAGSSFSDTGTGSCH
jgi:hypothetical protein